MKNMQTKSHKFIAVRLETTGNLDRKLLVVVQKFNIVVTPIITLAGTAFTSSQKLMKELVTRTIPGTNTVLK
jgi:Mn2+/Fe2+ NRAMP family transporter